ncbi:WAT1-related protein At4g15540 isoform X2 [Rosa chinensis]|uniref:WAT1-related protein At4g15540 isoform X2 n=1 Tax=Rosa chinensis TaxID=74649 RepID=UPI001AD8C861|nr:WAT1-related protein At4g15540 isoform X2 [Rosa chinensis]
MAGRSCYRDVLPFAAMVTVESTNVGLNILFKLATTKGLSYYVFIVYSYAFATVLLLPLPFIFPRTRLPPLNFSLLFKAFLLGLIGFVANICAYKGIDYSSPTLASAMSNLTPAFTFILAVIFRMERLSLRSTNTRAKVMGTIVSVSGALVVVLCKGPTILSNTSERNWVKGGLLLTVGYLLFSAWSILQTLLSFRDSLLKLAKISSYTSNPLKLITHFMKTYPVELVWALLYNLFGTIISAPVCLFIAETNLSAWRLRPGVALIAIIYSGLIISAFSTIVSTWSLNLKGPVYVSIFKPLSIGIAAASSVIFLGDDLFLGSVFGAVMISIGFYGVIWGQAKEEEMRDQDYEFDSLKGLHNEKEVIRDRSKAGGLRQLVTRFRRPVTGDLNPTTRLVTKFRRLNLFLPNNNQ